MLVHEVRGPLATVAMTAELLERAQEQLPVELHDAVRTLERNVRRLRGVFDDLTGLARLAEPMLTLARLPFHISDTVEDAVEDAATGFDLQQVDVLVERAPNLPVRAYGDAQRVSQVVSNLVHNALKFTDVGVVRVRIGHVATGEQTWLELSVEDTGRGMTAEEREQALQHFFRGRPDAHGHGQNGMGLGLAIVHGIVRRHHGTIELLAREGGGTRIEVRLQLDMDPPTAPAPAPTATRSVALSTPHEPLAAWLNDELALAGVRVERTDPGAAVLPFERGRADARIIDCRGGQFAAGIHTDNVPTLYLHADGQEACGQPSLQLPTRRRRLRRALLALFREAPIEPVAALDSRFGMPRPILSQRVALVEDCPDQRKYMAQAIRAAGFDVQAFPDVTTFEAGSTTFGIVLIDANLPDDSGFALAARIRSTWRPAPRLILISASSFALPPDGSASVFDAHATKPLSLGALSRLLNSGSQDENPAPSTSQPTTAERQLDVAPERRGAYWQRRRDEFEELVQLARRSEWSELVRISHMRKGSATMYGFDQLGRLFAELHEAARSEDDSATLLALAGIDTVLGAGPPL